VRIDNSLAHYTFCCQTIQIDILQGLPEGRYSYYHYKENDKDTTGIDIT